MRTQPRQNLNHLAPLLARLTSEGAPVVLGAGLLLRQAHPKEVRLVVRGDRVSSHPRRAGADGQVMH